jgi:hypothetical protein
MPRLQAARVPSDRGADALVLTRAAAHHGAQHWFPDAHVALKR